MITPSFLLQQTATKVMRHGMHQDNPGLATTNTQDSSVQADALPVLVLRVVECRRTMPITGHTENPTATDCFWVFSAVQPCKVLLFPQAGRWQALHFREQHDWLQAGVYPALQRCSRTDCWPTGWEGWCGPTAGQHMLLMLQAEWEVFLWNLCVFTQVLMPVILALIFVFWGRDSTSWYTDALSELKSWQILLIIFARAPQGRPATLSRCVSHFLAY